MENSELAKVQGRLTLVGFLSLVWNALLAVGYLMANLRVAGFLDAMGTGADTMQLFDAMPYWALAAWTIGVGGGVAGPLLLLLRSRFAVWAFAVSLLGLAAFAAYWAGAGLPNEMTTPVKMLTMLAIGVVALLLLVYSIRLRRQGLLDWRFALRSLLLPDEP